MRKKVEDVSKKGEEGEIYFYQKNLLRKVFRLLLVCVSFVLLQEKKVQELVLVKLEKKKEKKFLKVRDENWKFVEKSEMVKGRKFSKF